MKIDKETNHNNDTSSTWRRQTNRSTFEIKYSISL